MSINQESIPTRHAWKVLLGLFALILILGIGEFRQGQSGDPGMVEAISGTRWTDLQDTSPGIASLLDVETRIVGSLWAGLGLFGMAVSFTGYRKREKWAWWSAWALPLVMAMILGTFLTAGLVPDSPTPPALYSAPFTILVSAFTLLFSIRTFFPKADGESPERYSRPVEPLSTSTEDGDA